MPASSIAEPRVYPPVRPRNGRVGWLAASAAVVAIAALSTLLVAPAPSYDPWSWLQWGREISGGELHTAAGPAFKPLPVAVTSLLSLVGGAAPWLWVAIARVGAGLALWLSFRLGRRLAGGSVPAGLAAAAGVALCGAFLEYSATGLIAGWVVALALMGGEAWRSGRADLALACAVGCALLQVEAWPFVAVLALVLWRRRAVDRRLLVAVAVAVPVLWFLPEWLGSGDLLRSAERARIPNAGQPALAEVPALASIEKALRLPLWPLWLGVGALLAVALRGGTTARAALVPAAAGAAWMAVVALMSQLGGFSGEPRYALPGMALVAISGAVGLVTAGRRSAGPVSVAALAVVVGLIALAALPRLDGVTRLPAAQAYQWRLATELSDAIDASGGRDAALACGRVFVGPFRGPLMAYRLEVPKRTVEPDFEPVAPGTVFRSRRAEGLALEPAVGSGWTRVAVTPRWDVLRAC
jgi:hypothetical protein